MWCVFKYVIDTPDTKNEKSTQPMDESEEDSGFEDITETIKSEIDKNADNYIISLHYLDFPVVLYYGRGKMKEGPHLKSMVEFYEPAKEARKILLMNRDDYVKGFYFLRKQIAVQKNILAARDQDTFDRRASESGLEPYIINDLRTMWKNKRLECLQAALAHHVETYYLPDTNHELYKTFISYLEETYKRGVDRFKTFICIGSTFIGKSVFFSKFIVPEEYYIYHSNYLEYSKMPDQPNKIFRILDDINWDQVTSTELKSLMNRNISSVNIKYGYEYIFPLIPIIIMNGEDYKMFRQHFSDIWVFIEKNAVIYPPQKGKEVKEEQTTLFTNRVADETDPNIYLFNHILNVNRLKECTMNNMNEWIKKILNSTESWKYDTHRYIQLPEKQDMRIPNPELSKKTILKQYEEYILKKKLKEMNTPEDEKKPREPWYRTYYTRSSIRPSVGTIPKKRSKPTKFDDLNEMSSDEYKKKTRHETNSEDEDTDEESLTGDDEISGDTIGSEDSETGSEDTTADAPDYMKGFIQI